MLVRLVAIVTLSLAATAAQAQQNLQQDSPQDLQRNLPPVTEQGMPLPPVGAGPAMPLASPMSSPMAPPMAPGAAPPAAPPPPGGADAAAPGVDQGARVFCNQSVSARLAPPESVAPQFRPLLGIWSDAAWDVHTCAALIVETVKADGTASIVYVYGPQAANARGPGAVLHGTGIVRDGALSFQNTDGSQFVFRPAYADLAGIWTTPQGQTYQATFKKSF